MRRSDLKLLSVAALPLLLLASTVGSTLAGAQQSPACDDEPGFHALDFWLGEWTVWSGEVQVGFNRIVRVQQGCAIEEHWESAAGGTGQSLFYYLPASEQWRQVWVTPYARAAGGVKEKRQVEAPDGAVRFRGVIQRPDGTTYLDRTTLTPLGDGRVRQHIEVSTDEGEGWKTTFDAEYRPAGDRETPTGPATVRPSQTLVTRTDSYRIAIDPSNLRLARVDAEVTPTADGELLLLRDAADSGIEGGWAAFLEDLEVRTLEDEPLAVESLEQGRFRVAGVSGPVRVRYAMRLEHDRVENLPGADELAWARPDAVLWSGRALLLEGAPGREIRVDFSLPEGWRATTPWEVLEPGSRFRAHDTDALLDSAFIAGRHFEARLGDGDDAAVRIALAGPGARSQSDLIVETVERYLGVFGKLFGAPSEGRLLLVAADGSFWGGGVLGTTISMMLGGELDSSTLPILRFVTVHEAFHLWNGNFRYRGQEGQESLYWMSEGTASYYTLRSQLGADELSEEAALAQLADEVSKYRGSLAELSMVAAGPTKLSNYDLIYSGGFLASMALDIAIRTRTADRHSLDDVMRSLHSGPGRESEIDVDGFGDVVESTTGVTVDDLIACCVEGTEVLPLTSLFRQLGLVLTMDETSVSVERDPDAGAEAAARWDAWPLR